MIVVNTLLIKTTVLLLASIYSVPVSSYFFLTPLYACEGTTLNIKCDVGVIHVLQENYGRLSKYICNNSLTSNVNCRSNSLNIVKNECSNKSSCSIAARNSVFGDPCMGTSKYLEVLYQCILEPKSAPKQLIACEGTTMNIKCSAGTTIKLIRVNYGRLSRSQCYRNGGVPHFTGNCVSKNSFGIMDARCSNRKSCSIKAVNSIFGDPCYGTLKYLDVQYQCITSLPPTDKNAVACEGSTLKICCENNRQAIIIQRANFGRTSKKQCKKDGQAFDFNNLCMSYNSNIIASKYCWRNCCRIPATSNVFGDQCPGTFKYLDVNYICTTN